MTSLFARVLPVALAAFVFPAASTAGGPQRFDVSASASAASSYDDNVFAAPGDGLEDMVSRLGARLGLAWSSPRFTARAHGAREAETFARHPELNTSRAFQEAGLDLAWLPVAGFEATGSASYVETNSPGELNVIGDLGLAAIALRRGRAHRFAATGALSWRLGARTKAALAYAFTQDGVLGGVSSATRVTSATLHRQAGPRDAFAFACDRRDFTALGSDS